MEQWHSTFGSIFEMRDEGDSRVITGWARGCKACLIFVAVAFSGANASKDPPKNIIKMLRTPPPPLPSFHSQTLATVPKHHQPNPLNLIQSSTELLYLNGTKLLRSPSFYSSSSSLSTQMPPLFLPPPHLHIVRRKAMVKMIDTPPQTKKLPEWPPPTLLPMTLQSKHAASYYQIQKPKNNFFEGWYLRLTLPNSADSYAFMFAIEADGLGTLQLLTPSDKLHVREITGKFAGDKKKFSVGQWGYGEMESVSDTKTENILQGYQLSSTATHGVFRGSRKGSGSGIVQWALEFSPLLTWGTRGTSRNTATWLSNLQLFQPGYQVLMAHGVATGGYIIADGVRVDVTGAVVYSEKNWGRGFPRKWWWVQANGFWNCRDLSVLSCGAIRGILGREETVGIIAVHYEGQLYEFANWSCESLQWSVDRWGYWKAWSKSRTGHMVEFEASASEPPVSVLGPSDNGMVFNVRDCARGLLTLTLKDEDGNCILDRVACDNAQVEVGGEWEDDWKASVTPMPWPLRSLVNQFNGPKVCTSL